MKKIAFLGFVFVQLMGCEADGPAGAAGERALNERSCAAYIWLDANVRETRGEITPQELDAVGLRLVQLLFGDGDRYTSARDFQRIENEGYAILDADPTVAELAAKVEECRPILRV